MATHSSILAWRITKDRGAWRAIVHRVVKSQTRLKRFSKHAYNYLHSFGVCREFSIYSSLIKLLVKKLSVQVSA